MKHIHIDNMSDEEALIFIECMIEEAHRDGREYAQNEANHFMSQVMVKESTNKYAERVMKYSFAMECLNKLNEPLKQTA